MRRWVVGWDIVADADSGETLILLPGFRTRWGARNAARRANRVRANRDARVFRAEVVG
jgi:hypothetical protein